MIFKNVEVLSCSENFKMQSGSVQTRSRHSLFFFYERRHLCWLSNVQNYFLKDGVFFFVYLGGRKKLKEKEPKKKSRAAGTSSEDENNKGTKKKQKKSELIMFHLDKNKQGSLGSPLFKICI